MLNREIRTVCFIVGLFVPLASMAQVARMPGVVDKKIPEVEIPKSKSLDAAPAQPLEQAPEVKKVANPKQSIATLKSVVFKGNTVVKEGALQKVVSKYLDKKITAGDLAELKYEVKKVYYDKGYILVRVVTEPQDFSNGVLKVSIYEAKVGEVIVSKNDVINQWTANKIASVNKTGEILREDHVESMISDLNDLSNVKASVNLRPGKKFSETDLYVNIDKTKENVNVIGVNNYGSPYTGEIVTSAHLEQGNLLKMGEKLSLDVHRSNEDLWDVGVSASAPIGFRGVTFEANYLHSENEIGDNLEALKASGRTDSFSFALSDKLINTRNRQVAVSFGYENRVHESFLSDISDTKDNIRKLFTEASYLQRFNNSVYYGSLKLSKGIDAFGASQKGEFSSSRVMGDQEAWILQPTLLANLRPFGENGTIKAFIVGQAASEALLSSDLFAIGGYGSVRGFDVSQEVGEAGYSFTLEYNHRLPINVNKVTFKAGPFIDGGAVNSRVARTVQDTHLYSAGLGLEAVAKIVPVGDTTLRLDWAHPVGSYRATNVSDDTFYINLKQAF